MMTQVDSKSVEVLTWEDLTLMVVQMPAPVIHRIKRGKEFVYFTYFQLVPARTMVIYYLRSNERIKQRFVVYDRIHSSVSFGDKLTTGPNLIHVPIVDVKKEDVLPKKLI